MSNHFVREFIFDDEQISTLQAKYQELQDSLYPARVYSADDGSHLSDLRRCDHVSFTYKEFPDISQSLLRLSEDLEQPQPFDLWFGQFEFIRYEGLGQTFEKHNDDNEQGSRHNRLLTSVTLIEKSDDLVGGKLKIWVPNGGEYLVDLKPFETIIFPSYYYHEATPLISGRRVVLVSWAQRGR